MGMDRFLTGMAQGFYDSQNEAKKRNDLLATSLIGTGNYTPSGAVPFSNQSLLMNLLTGGMQPAMAGQDLNYGGINFKYEDRTGKDFQKIMDTERIKQFFKPTITTANALKAVASGTLIPDEEGNIVDSGGNRYKQQTNIEDLIKFRNAMQANSGVKLYGGSSNPYETNTQRPSTTKSNPLGTTKSNPLVDKYVDF